eukprot:scaffold56226_cov21-Tisochrysis_lutea.AAC.5
MLALAKSCSVRIASDPAGAGPRVLSSGAAGGSTLSQPSQPQGVFQQAALIPQGKGVTPGQQQQQVQQIQQQIQQQQAQQQLRGKGAEVHKSAEAGAPAAGMAPGQSVRPANGAAGGKGVGCREVVSVVLLILACAH